MTSVLDKLYAEGISALHTRTKSSPYLCLFSFWCCMATLIDGISGIRPVGGNLDVSGCGILSYWCGAAGISRLRNMLAARLPFLLCEQSGDTSHFLLKEMS